MSTIKQVLLGAAVAGVVAGTGSAVSVAVAHADPSDTNGSTASSDSSPSRGGGSTARTHTRSKAAQPGPAAATTSRAGRDSSVAEEVLVPSPRANQDSPAIASQPAPALPSAPTATAPAATPQPEAAAPIQPVSTPDNTPAPVSAPTVPPAVRAAAAVAQPAVTVAAPAAAAVADPAPAPAAPAPIPVREPLLPLLPTLPALPVAPASAVTVSATSGSNGRLRAASAVAQAAALADPPATHVLLIGVDGTNLDKILQYTWNNPDSTGFQELMDEGTTSATSIVGHTTISGPSWTTILTGVWDTKSGVINNLFNPKPYHDWPTVFNMLENHDPSIDTAVVADWKYINDMAAAGVSPVEPEDNHYIAFDTSWADTDQKVTDKTIALIAAADADTPTFLFSYQVQVDEAGHAFGGGSAEYRDAVINVGENIAEIMDAVHAAELATGEQWTVIVTTDHGHQQSKGFGHGFQSPNETSSFIIFDQAGDPAGGKQNQSFANTDITPTIVNMFGAPMRSDFDGVPLDTKGSGLVTPVDLETSLNDAISMYGYPNIGVDIALGTRTIFATVPYLIDGFVNNITGMLQTVIDKDIFLISGIAQVTQWIVQFNGDLAVGVTQAIARVVAWMTGSGRIPPTDPPLTPNPAESSDSLLVDGNLVLT